MNNAGDYERFVAAAARLTRWMKNFEQFYENWVAYASTPLYVRDQLGQKTLLVCEQRFRDEEFCSGISHLAKFPRDVAESLNLISLVLLTSFQLSEALKVPFIPRPSAYHIKR